MFAAAATVQAALSLLAKLPQSPCVPGSCLPTFPHPVHGHPHMSTNQPGESPKSGPMSSQARPQVRGALLRQGGVLCTVHVQAAGHPEAEGQLHQGVGGPGKGRQLLGPQRVQQALKGQVCQLGLPRLQQRQPHPAHQLLGLGFRVKTGLLGAAPHTSQHASATRRQTCTNVCRGWQAGRAQLCQSVLPAPQQRMPHPVHVEWSDLYMMNGPTILACAGTLSG